MHLEQFKKHIYIVLSSPYMGTKGWSNLRGLPNPNLGSSPAIYHCKKDPKLSCKEPQNHLRWKGSLEVIHSNSPSWSEQGDALHPIL